MKTENITMDLAKKLGSGQIAIQCNIDTEAKGGVSKLLSASGEVMIDSVMCDDGVRINGKLNIKVVCLDTEGVLQSYDYLSDYDERIKLTVNSEFTLSAKSMIMDIDSAMAGSVIKVQAIVNIDVYGEMQCEYPMLRDVDKNIIVKNKDITHSKLVENINDMFTIIEEYECGVVVDKILLYDSCVICTSAKVNDGALIVNGEISATVVYESEGMITTKCFNLPFNEEIRIRSDHGKAMLKLCVSDSRIVLQGDHDENIMRLEIKIGVMGGIYHEMNCRVIEDACSATNVCNCTLNNMDYTNYITQMCLKDKIVGSAEVTGENFNIRKILSTTASRNCITNCYCTDNGIIVEGILSVSVIYEDTNTDVNSVQMELPYSLPFDTDKVREQHQISCDSIVEILSSKIKRDSEIEVTALITVSATISEMNSCKSVTSIEMGEALSNELPVLTVYQPQANETLWDIAKTIIAPIESIMMQNPNLTEKTVGNCKVVYFRSMA